MISMRQLLVVPLVLAASISAASEIRDGAKMFSPQAVRRAEAILNNAAVPVVIESIPSLEGRSPDREVLTRARQHPSARVYVLISKGDNKLRFAENNARFTQAQDKAIKDAFFTEFKQNRFDAGLIAGADAISSAVSTWTNKRVAARQNGSGWMFLFIIGGIILVVLLSMRVLGALFGGNRGAGYGPSPGMGAGGPGMGYGGGYGRGGGGFFSGLMGGLGGAIAGNWMYDQFRGRGHDSGSHGVDPTGGVDDNAGWGGVGGGDWGGDGGGGFSDGGGGDWGGGGGGDWGGGGGSDWS